MIMKRTITQKSLAEILTMSSVQIHMILSGRRKVGAKKAAALEYLTGIGIRTWLFGSPAEIRIELERVYGRINFKRGRPPKSKREGNP